MNATVSREILEQFAKNSKMLGLLDDLGIERLARHGRLMACPLGTVVVRQGETGGTFYLIASGEVRVLVSEAGDKEVARLGPGMFFGEIAVITRQPRSATVETTRPTDLICFSREPVVAILRDYPKVREFLGNIGLARTEENINHMLDDPDGGGLADLLEGDDPPLQSDSAMASGASDQASAGDFDDKTPSEGLAPGAMMGGAPPPAAPQAHVAGAPPAVNTYRDNDVLREAEDALAELAESAKKTPP